MGQQHYEILSYKIWHHYNEQFPALLSGSQPSRKYRDYPHWQKQPDREIAIVKTAVFKEYCYFEDLIETE